MVSLMLFDELIRIVHVAVPRRLPDASRPCGMVHPACVALNCPSQATCEWANLWDTIEGLDFDMQYSVAFHVILMHSRLVAEFRPDLILIAPMPDTTEHAFWPPPRSRAQGRARRRKLDGAHADADGNLGGPPALEAVADGDAGAAGSADASGDGAAEQLLDALVHEEADEADVAAEDGIHDDGDCELFAELDAVLDRRGSVDHPIPKQTIGVCWRSDPLNMHR